MNTSEPPCFVLASAAVVASDCTVPSPADPHPVKNPQPYADVNQPESAVDESITDVQRPELSERPPKWQKKADKRAVKKEKKKGNGGSFKEVCHQPAMTSGMTAMLYNDGVDWSPQRVGPCCNYGIYESDSMMMFTVRFGSPTVAGVYSQSEITWRCKIGGCSSV
uniref:Uncharacterized protein n=1 Tax=Chromera velia CCMP2878 TaxID=1169474 RepID=A0A0G4FIK3_9ALVE|eukprot:Cvel_17181.t1-p1 / transcript=Cvel_17181.t1 / gene=Cvel_17181 / organism=Chromera_velia_CCMP2878 / gene_product=hypothetical protein / transcript_product=hypothetical protein / location=Cvel_scaffold1357:26055-26546(+) / protein_length=164 / sequence_SO=supercontig / SO=protein_coding / is_pseudo=false